MDKSPVDKFYEWHAAELKDLEENGPKKRRGRKPSKKQYFTYITDQAIHAYNEEESYQKRNLLIFVTASIVSRGGSPVRENIQNITPQSIFKDPVILTPTGTIRRNFKEQAGLDE